MILADQLWKIWGRLGSRWSPYFKLAGLDLHGASRENFEERLQRHIEVEYTLAGLEEFSRHGCRGIEPGDPALSLFYHVLASPRVIPEGIADCHYPSMAELEIVENYIYSTSLPSIDVLLERAKGSDLAIAVFAYEYAVAADTVHGRHADLTFSRTGISRVGNADRNYVPKARGFFPHSTGKKVHVVPARFGAFIAVQRQGNSETIGPMRFNRKDHKEKFWVPLHKLFNGTECIADHDLELSIEAMHVNQKIKKVHLALQSEGIDTKWNASDMQLPPFVLTEDLATFDPAGSLVVPTPHHPLVEPARSTQKKKLVGFPVPPHHKQLGGALWFADEYNALRSPEFVHAKHAILTDAEGKQSIAYLPETDPRAIDEVVWEGKYEAANFIDWTADGWVKTQCPALEKSILKQLPAFSILAQPDFFPLVKQQDLMKWWEKSAPKDIKRRIWPDQSITPSPLSNARYPVNITLSGASFDSTDRTMTAIIGVDRKPGPQGKLAAGQPRRESTLSYRATNLFEPGWDSSEDFSRDLKTTRGTYHLANYGLGSPYPEDTLICAAFGAFWPGAVPDVTRFFAPDTYPSTTPILDEQAQWDGVPLPTTGNGITQYKSFGYADYVRAIGEGTFRYEEFADVTLEDYISRTAATARVFQFLKVSKASRRARYPFLSFRHPNRTEMQFLKKNGWEIDSDRTYRIEVGRVITVCKPMAATPKVTPANLENFLVLYAAEFAIAHHDPKYPGKLRVNKF